MRYFLIFIIFFTNSFAAFTNDLIYEKSPYLRQHAHNPVNWLPWGQKAFQKAKKEKKPIFLSIGYSTCHWCHVMERESFENEEIAKLINDNFIPVIVDKEERPDIDKFYQTIYQIMHNRSGGWPLTIILTEDLKPFFSATYLPPEDGYGVKGLKTVLPLLSKMYKEKREDIERRADAILSLMKRYESAQYLPVRLNLDIASKFTKEAFKEFDKKYKGFSNHIKFPESSKIRALIDIYMITKDKKAFNMANETLIAMAKSGLFDQIDGAFFRYTTDRRWQIPHFEKMLYTNAELIDVYIRMYKLTKNPLFKNIIQKTIFEIDNRFQQNGLYFSASDADTKGVEGGYFIHSYQKTLEFFIKNGFTLKDAKRVLNYFGIYEDGNIDGEYSNPHINSKIKISKDQKLKALKLLKKIREKREFPFIDKKILTSWNAMYIDAKMNGCYIDEKYKDEAIKSLNRLLIKMYKNGILYHQFIGENKPTKKALLEDYAYLIKALLDAYKYTLNEKYLKLSQKLLNDAKKRFFKNGKWLLSSNGFSSVADLNDRYYSSPLSIMIHNFLILANLKENFNYLKDAKNIIDSNSALIYENPIYYPEAIRAILRLNIEDVIIKSKKSNIIKYYKKILDIKYPYILVKEEKVDRFLACKIDRCFADGSLKEVIKKIENLLNFKNRKSKWNKKIKSLVSQ